MKHATLFVLLLAVWLPGALPAVEFQSTWDHSPDRVWLGPDTWTNPMEDWQLRDGKAECISTGANRNVALLTHDLDPGSGGFVMSVRIEKAAAGTTGSAGFRIGIKDKVEDYRAAAMRGRGLDCGLTAEGQLFIGKPPRKTITQHGLNRKAWRIQAVSTTQGGAEAPEAVLDGDPTTFWHSKYATVPYPHEMELDLGKVATTTGLGYLPRQGSTSGHFKDYEIYLSTDGKAWGDLVAAGTFASREDLQRATWKAAKGRYLRLVMKNSHAPRPAASIAELYVFGPDTAPVVEPVAPVVADGPWLLTLTGEPGPEGLALHLACTQADSGKSLGEMETTVKAPGSGQGGVGLFHLGAKTTSARFAFSDWRIAGDGVQHHPDRAWGPILWAMHSLSHSRGVEGHVLKLTAQMPPLGIEDNRTVDLQVQDEHGWNTVASTEIDDAACTARFRVPRWDATRMIPYRLVYLLKTTHGQSTEYRYAGAVRRDPVDRPLVVAGFTGNTDYVFPNVEIAHNVGMHDPDVLFFSGDQIYEGVGGYGIHRTPADRSTLNYLRKWYLLGWAFGDLMRDRVTICLPDDHDVYQGNIWGEGGIDPGGMAMHDAGGYAQPVEMVNAVHRTQTSHHPDAFDPTPIARDISVYYGDMVYGRVSFAILADRMFKSGPKGKVDTGSGRADHVLTAEIDVAALDRPNLQLLGTRQEAFLEDWTADWRQADMKMVLSQTIFCNLANYHGPAKQFIIADLDSNGWPQSRRNQALALMRKGNAFHYAGDQHLPSMVHNGIDTHRDAGWSFCVPSIAAGYPRSWLPDKEGRPVKNRPAPGLPNTGDYLDGFGNRVTVYGVGNPAEVNRTDTPALLAHDKSSGYGIVRMDQEQQTITMECWRLMADLGQLTPENQFPGWPRTIHQFDNDGRRAVGHLPALTFAPGEAPVVQVIDEADGDVLYTVRVKQASFRPKVFKPGSYTVKISDPDRGTEKIMKQVRPVSR